MDVQYAINACVFEYFIEQMMYSIVCNLNIHPCGDHFLFRK